MAFETLSIKFIQAYKHISFKNALVWIRKTNFSDFYQFDCPKRSNYFNKRHNQKLHCLHTKYDMNQCSIIYVRVLDLNFWIILNIPCEMILYVSHFYEKSIKIIIEISSINSSKIGFIHNSKLCSMLAHTYFT